MSSTETPIVAFARDVLGFALYPRQSEILTEVYADGIRTAVLRLGRRSGKGRISAVIATFEATVNASTHLAHLPAGERCDVVIVATSQRQASIVHKYVRGFLARPALAPLVVRETETEIELRSGVSILTLPASAAAVRGLATPVIVMDEAAHFLGRDQSPLDASAIWDALIPGSASFPQAKILILSTPRWSVGWFHDLVKLAGSGKYADMRAWHETTAAMNPGIPASFLAAEAEKDPPSFRREYLAEWDSGIGALFGAPFVQAAVREQGDLIYRADAGRYVLAVDSGFVSDSFACLAAHREPDGMIVIDRVFGFRGSHTQPVLLDPTLDAVAALSAAYGGCPCIIDQYGAAIIAQGLIRRGVQVLARPWTAENKELAATSTRRAMFAGKLSIPAHADLVAQLSSLESRPLPTGRVRIAAPAGGHDDYAMAALAAIADLAAETPAPAGGYVDPGRGDENVYGATRERPDRPLGFGLGSVDRSRRSRLDLITRITH